MASKPQFSPQAAQSYVNQRIQAGGGLGELWRGFRYRTLLDLSGLRDVGLLSVSFAFLRFGTIVVAACLPTFSKRVGEARAAEKLAMAAAHSPAPAPVTGASSAASGAHPGLAKKVFDWQGVSFDLLDVLLIGGAFVLAVWPPLWAWYKKHTAEDSRSRALEALSGSIQGLPAPGAAAVAGDVSASCAVALNGLKNEISRAIGDESGDLTDAALLVFADDQCSTMKVLARTEAAEADSIGRVVDAAELQAYYVAKSGEVFAEHDFGGERSPFPAIRITPLLANTPAHYKSILFIPVMVRPPATAHGVKPSVRRGNCVGVICIHSKHRYRFWKLGDQNSPQSRGEVTNAAVRKISPYHQVIAHCLKTNYPQLAV